MCFSATASFTAASVLIPAGCYSLSIANKGDRRFWLLASFPLLFGIQQLFGGLLWLALTDAPYISVRHTALGFLLFAFGLWPLLAPLAALQFERNPARRHWFTLITALGGAFGLSLFVPLLFGYLEMNVGFERHSIVYLPELIYDGYFSNTWVSLFYVVIVTVPLMFSGERSLQVFGYILLASLVVSGLFFIYAFLSVWCYTAAILSLYVVYIIRNHATVAGDNVIRKS